jgi:hypothetical protein
MKLWINKVISYLDDHSPLILMFVFWLIAAYFIYLATSSSFTGSTFHEGVFRTLLIILIFCIFCILSVITLLNTVLKIKKIMWLLILALATVMYYIIYHYFSLKQCGFGRGFINQTYSYCYNPPDNFSLYLKISILFLFLSWIISFIYNRIIVNNEK